MFSIALVFILPTVYCIDIFMDSGDVDWWGFYIVGFSIIAIRAFLNIFRT